MFGKFIARIVTVLSGLGILYGWHTTLRVQCVGIIPNELMEIVVLAIPYIVGAAFTGVPFAIAYDSIHVGHLNKTGMLPIQLILWGLLIWLASPIIEQGATEDVQIAALTHAAICGALIWLSRSPRVYSSHEEAAEAERVYAEQAVINQNNDLQEQALKSQMAANHEKEVYYRGHNFDEGHYGR